MQCKKTHVVPPRLAFGPEQKSPSPTCPFISPSESPSSITVYRLRRLAGHDMGLRDLFCLPKSNRRKQSKARSETGLIGGTSEVDEVLPSRPATGSAPDLPISALASRVPGPSTFHDQELNGTRACSSWVIYLTVFFPHGADPPSISDRFRSTLSERQSKPTESSNPTVNPSARDESKPNWKSTASSTAKLLLLGVRESSDAFGPLKSVAGGLCFVLENCEVSTSFCVCHSRCSKGHQRTKANKQSIESLAPRICALAESLCAPVPKGDIREQSRRNVLERLDHALRF